MNTLAGQEQRHRHREQTCGHSGQRRGWGKLRVALKHIHDHIKQIANGKLRYNTRSSTWCSVTTQRDGMVREQEEVHEGGDVGTRAAESQCKAIMLQLRINFKKRTSVIHHLTETKQENNCMFMSIYLTKSIAKGKELQNVKWTQTKGALLETQKSLLNR